MPSEIGGRVTVKFANKILAAKGAFTYGLGKQTRTGQADNGKVVGYTTSDNVPFWKGQLYDVEETDIEEIADFVGKQSTLDLNNGKIITFNDSWTVNDDGATGDTKEGAINIHVQAKSASVTRK